MLEALGNLAIFAAQAIIVVVAISCIFMVIAASRKDGSTPKGSVQILDLNTQLREQQTRLIVKMQDKAAAKQYKKAQKQRAAAVKRQAKNKSGGDQDGNRRILVMDFHGDIRASQNHSFARTITAAIQLATPGRDEVMVRLESAGGMVHAYGLAASQLQRLREAGIECTVCVDKIAASGGYMMACVANHIVAAPFALVGSIGVVAQLPNIHRLLQRWEVDVEQHTAGKYKRTLTTIGKNTPEGRRKFKQDLERTHKLFQDMVKHHRPQLPVAKLATGEVWYGQEAQKLKLIDQLGTSDSWLLARHQQAAGIYLITYKEKKPLSKRIQLGAVAVLAQLIAKIQQTDYEQRLINTR